MPVIVKYRVYLLQFRERGLKYVLAVRVVCSNPNRERYQTLGTDTKIYYVPLVYLSKRFLPFSAISSWSVHHICCMRDTFRPFTCVWYLNLTHLIILKDG